MTVFVVTLLGQAGGRLSGFATDLVERTGRTGPVLIGIMLTQAVLAAVAIIGGVALAPQVTPDTRTLMLAVALVLVALGMAGGLPRSGSTFGRPRLGAFGTALLGGGAILCGDSGWMLVAAAAARSPLPWAAWPGAMLGLFGAMLPPLMLGAREWRRMPWRAIRLVIGAGMVVVAVVVALATKGLI